MSSGPLDFFSTVDYQFSELILENSYVYYYWEKQVFKISFKLKVKPPNNLLS